MSTLTEMLMFLLVLLLGLTAFYATVLVTIRFSSFVILSVIHLVMHMAPANFQGKWRRAIPSAYRLLLVLCGLGTAALCAGIIVAQARGWDPFNGAGDVSVSDPAIWSYLAVNAVVAAVTVMLNLFMKFSIRRIITVWSGDNTTGYSVEDGQAPSRSAGYAGAGAR